MKLTMRARHKELDLSVADIHGNVKLSQMAKCEEEPRSWEESSFNIDASLYCRRQVSNRWSKLIEYGLSPGNVLDILCH